MTRKHFIMVAKVFAKYEPHDKTTEAWHEWHYLVTAFATHFMVEFPSFNEEKFREACGITK